jgi:hypothetical protein
MIHTLISCRKGKSRQQPKHSFYLSPDDEALSYTILSWLLIASFRSTPLLIVCGSIFLFFSILHARIKPFIFLMCMRNSSRLLILLDSNQSNKSWQNMIYNNIINSSLLTNIINYFICMCERSHWPRNEMKNNVLIR